MFNNKLKLHKTGQGTENGTSKGDKEEERREVREKGTAKSPVCL